MVALDKVCGAKELSSQGGILGWEAKLEINEAANAKSKLSPLLQMDRQSMQLQAVAHYVDAGLSERAFTAQAVERTLPGPLQGNVNVSGVRTCRTRMVTP